MKQLGKAQDAFVTFLDLLGVKHTKSFSKQYFNEHPHKYNLYGLSKMLLDYGVENVATVIPDKENDITEIQTPFIAHFGGDFVVIDEVKPDHVSYIWRSLKNSIPVSKICWGLDWCCTIGGSFRKIYLTGLQGTPKSRAI